MQSDVSVNVAALLLWRFCCLCKFSCSSSGQREADRWGQCVGLLSCSALFHQMIQAAANMLLYAFPPVAFASKDKLWKPLLTYHENKNEASHTLPSCVTFSVMSLGSVQEHIDEKNTGKYSYLLVFIKRRKETKTFLVIQFFRFSGVVFQSHNHFHLALTCVQIHSVFRFHWNLSILFCHASHHFCKST